MRETTRICCGLMAALALVAFSVQSSFAAPKTAKAGQHASPRSRVTKTRTIDTLYQDWSGRYLQAGGDRNVVIGLGPARGLTPATQAQGFLLLNLITGDITAYVKGLTEVSDLYLVDNQPGPGKSFLPEQGDSIVHIGRLQPRGNAVAMLTTNLGSDFFTKFELDLAVVSQADASPVKSRVLIGTRSYFERRHTRERLGLAAHGAPGSVMALETSPSQVLVSHGLVSQDVFEGGELFFRETFQGNGRTCGSCHPVANNLAIDPKFIKALHARDPADPLFVAEKLHPNPVLNLEKPQLMRNFGLILENVDGFGDPVNKFTMRGVPHSLSMSTSITPAHPNDEDGSLPDGSTLAFEQRTGWSGDGAPVPGLLRLFSMGAVIQHFTKRLERIAEVDFRPPTDEELDKMEAFMLTTGRTNDLDLASVTLTEPRADNGRVLFMTDAKCSACHNNAGANTSFAGDVNFNFNTGVERARIKLLDNQRIPLDGGFGGQNLVDFTFDSDGDGMLDSYGNGTFNTPPLVEAADTGPFFHTNAFTTIEDAVGFYSSDAFANSPGGAAVGGIDLSSQQTQDVAAFLRVINAAFNLSIAIQRIEAARDIEDVFGLEESVLTDTLLHLANEELEDARDVLKKKNLNHSAHGDIKDAIDSNTHAISSTDTVTRLQAISAAQSLAEQAKASLGTGLDFVMGEGNLVF